MSATLWQVVRTIPGARRLARALGIARTASVSRRFLLDRMPKNARCAEIGVHLGDFSEEILRRTEPAELHLIDPWRHETAEMYGDSLYGGQAHGQAEMDARHDGVSERFAAPIAGGQVVIQRGNSVDVLGRFPDAYFDWIYIDGNHLYEFVSADLEVAFRKTLPSGWITGDDYHGGGWWQGGVQRAVDEFVVRHAFANVVLRDGQFLLQKAPAAPAAKC